VPVNASEELAIEKVKGRLQGIPGPWVLLSNISHSSHSTRLSDEIDQVIIGPQGVFVVEVKHWDAAWMKQNAAVVDNEAERINDKAKRVAGKLKTAFDPGFVAPRFLLTRGGTGVQAGKRMQNRGVPIFGLGECRDLVDAEGAVRLSVAQVEQAALLLEPAARATLTGDLRSFAGLINLERIPAPDAPFHRAYRGQHPTRRDKVVLHLYDLSATDEKDGGNRASREYEVMQRWQKHRICPICSTPSRKPSGIRASCTGSPWSTLARQRSPNVSRTPTGVWTTACDTRARRSWHWLNFMSRASKGCSASFTVTSRRIPCGFATTDARCSPTSAWRAWTRR